MPDEKLSRLRGAASERKFGEAPILGKVPRTPGSAVRNKGGNSLRRKRRKKLSKVVLAWTCLIAFTSACVMVLVIAAYFRREAAAAGNPDMLAKLPTEFDEAFTEASSRAMPPLSEEEAIRLVKAALSNTSAGRVADHFALGEVSEPEEALRELAHIRRKEGTHTSLQWIGEQPANGAHLVEVVVVMENGSRSTNRLAQLIAGDDGKWRIDLDSYLRKVSPGWEIILTGKSETSLVRIFLTPDVYYNGMYADESVWKAYALASPDHADILYGYAKRGSPQDKALTRILDTEEPFHRATLRIRKDAESAKKQFQISGVVAENWVVGSADFDEAF